MLICRGAGRASPRMRCPFCGFADSKVVDSRDVEESIRRRRECLNPDVRGRFTTYERVQAVALYVVKKDGTPRGVLAREAAGRACANGVREAPAGARPRSRRWSMRSSGAVPGERARSPDDIIGELVMDRLRRARSRSHTCGSPASTGSSPTWPSCRRNWKRWCSGTRPSRGAVAAHGPGVLGHHSSAATGRTDNPNPYPPPGAAGADFGRRNRRPGVCAGGRRGSRRQRGEEQWAQGQDEPQKTANHDPARSADGADGRQADKRARASSSPAGRAR